MNDTKYSPLPIQKGQNRIYTFVYREDVADCSSEIYNYLVSCKWPKLAVPRLYCIIVEGPKTIGPTNSLDYH